MVVCQIENYERELESFGYFRKVYARLDVKTLVPVPKGSG
jgi:hypothetical protein